MLLLSCNNEAEMFAVATATATAVKRAFRRGLLDSTSPLVSLHFYLQRHDLLPHDRNYLQAIGKEDFTPSPIVEVAAAPRLAIVLPLQIEDGRDHGGCRGTPVGNRTTSADRRRLGSWRLPRHPGWQSYYLCRSKTAGSSQSH